MPWLHCSNYSFPDVTGIFMSLCLSSYCFIGLECPFCFGLILLILQVYVNLIIMNTLNLHSAVCQLYPNKTGRREEKNVRCIGQWFDLHTSWNDSHDKFSEHPLSHINTKLNKLKKVLFHHENSGFTPLTFLYNIQPVTCMYHLVHYIYLLTGSFWYLLTAFIQFPLLIPRVTTNLISFSVSFFVFEV